MARGKPRGGWRGRELMPALAGPLLREAGFIGEQGDPVRVRASYDGGGRLRRVHARYPGGWTCTLHVGFDGMSTLSQSLRLRVYDRLAR